MIKIGLTGGIGSGKTTVAKTFEAMGVPVYYADDRAKEIMQKDPAIKSEIIRLFGKQAYQDNQLNTSYISGIVFENTNKLQALEKIVHPAVRKDFCQWAKQQNADYIVVENAILHKTGMDKLVDLIVTVTANDEKRLKRLQERDKKPVETLKKIMKNQDKPSDLLKKSNFIIENDGDLENLRKKIVDLDSKVKIMLKQS
jgi:dephospho-CoA kinase